MTAILWKKSLTKHWILNWWYLLGLTFHQERFLPSEKNDYQNLQICWVLAFYAFSSSMIRNADTQNVETKDVKSEVFFSWQAAFFWGTSVLFLLIGRLVSSLAQNWTLACWNWITTIASKNDYPPFFRNVYRKSAFLLLPSLNLNLIVYAFLSVWVVSLSFRRFVFDFGLSLN